MSTSTVHHHEREKVVLHPLVLLSVVDHYNRVARDTKKRVVGILLGDIHKGVVDVSNSFACRAEGALCYLLSLGVPQSLLDDEIPSTVCHAA